MPLTRRNRENEIGGERRNRNNSGPLTRRRESSVCFERSLMKLAPRKRYGYALWRQARQRGMNERATAVMQMAKEFCRRPGSAGLPVF